ncbi:MAG: T9SS type A sorting domain-containing protein [Saprospiraceae bacterium]
MNTKIVFPTLVLIFIAIQLSGQSQDPSLIGSGGGMQKQGSFYLSYSLGEPFVEYRFNSDRWITEGYQQPEKINLSTGIKNILPPSTATIYPNPTTGFLHVEWPETFVCNQLTIENSLGQTLLHRDIPSNEYLNLSLDELCAGIYFIRLQFGVSSSLTSFIKI